MVEIQVRLVSFIAFYNFEILCFALFLLAPSIQSLRTQESRWSSCWSLLAFEIRWARPKQPRTGLPAPSYAVFQDLIRDFSIMLIVDTQRVFLPTLWNAHHDKCWTSCRRLEHWLHRRVSSSSARTGPRTARCSRVESRSPTSG